MTTSRASGSDPSLRLADGLQRWLWQQGWPSLRPIQARAIPAILARTHDVIVAAPTAGGKTEAAFLPILSDIAAQPPGFLRCLAIAPLRALITDQARRIELMAKAVEARIQPWHSDVSAGKAGFWKRPAEILMTTPESLEAMLMRRGPELARFAPGLRYLVVDELHAFIGSERGAQLASLLQRIEALAGRPIPRVALSATLGDMGLAEAFLRPDQALPALSIVGEGGGGELRMQLRAVYQPRAPITDADAPGRQQGDEAQEGVEALETEGAALDPAWNADIDAVEALFARARFALQSDLDGLPLEACTSALPKPPGEDEPEDTEDVPGNRYLTAMGQVCDHLFERLRGASHLVFANSRSQVELVADILRERCEAMGLPNEFFGHHGSLSREHRTFVEERLRAGHPPTTAVATSTLEMGIDLGDVESVVQIGPAPSVSALKQRVGRSGRRAGQAQVLRQYVILPALDPGSSLQDWLRLPLIQAMAATELMLEGRFEPPVAGDLHLSTLVQQLLSLIVQRSGLRVPEAYRALVEQGAFKGVSKALFLDTLRALHASETIEQLSDGTLLPGKRGEQVTAHYSFYAAFNTPDEFTLLASGRRLGTLPITEPLCQGQRIVFAGRRWQIQQIDEVDRTIHVTPSRGGSPPRFGSGGVAQHPIVHARMRALLESEAMPRYIDPVASEALGSARRAYRLFELDRRTVVPDGGATSLAHWAGSRVGATIALCLQSRDISARSEGPFVSLDVSPRRWPDVARGLLDDWPERASDLAAKVLVLSEEKFDPLLSRAVLAHGYAARHLDLDGARRVIGESLDRS